MKIYIPTRLSSTLFLGALLFSGSLSAQSSPTPPQESSPSPPLALFIEREQPARSIFENLSHDRQESIAKNRTRFYKARNYQYAWITPQGKIRPEAHIFLQALERAENRGLNPEDYGLSELKEWVGRIAERGSPLLEEAFTTDALLTSSFLLYATHRIRGRVDPRDLDIEWYTETRNLDPADLLTEALEGDGIFAVLETLEPWSPENDRLQQMLERYREIVAAGGWPTIPEGPGLEVGDPVPAATLEALVARLQAEGDLSSAAAARLRQRQPPEGGEAVYTQAIADAVSRFQVRHGLVPDGKVGRRTRAAMNVSAEQRVSTITYNLERLRWLPEMETGRRIKINIPDFSLVGMEGKREILRMRVVVGQTDWQTPVFTDQIQYIQLNPSWNVPRSIATQEILAEIQDDPEYLQKKGFEVLDGWSSDAATIPPSEVDWAAMSPETLPYRFRQKPGAANALGQIKFIFPNRFSVYLHDTPAQSAFTRHRRTLSHGCIRVARPLDLAEFVLGKKSGWSRRKLERAIKDDTPERISLSDQMPVFILYQTAFLDREGKAHFRNDYYDHDAALAEVLERRRPTARTTIAP